MSLKGKVANPRGVDLRAVGLSDLPPPPKMPEGWPYHLRECTKKAVRDGDMGLALWICQEIRKWDLFIGEIGGRHQHRVYLARTQYDCMCHEEGCRQMIKAGEPVLWAPDEGSRHAWHHPEECPPEFDQLPLEP